METNCGKAGKQKKQNDEKLFKEKNMHIVKVKTEQIDRKIIHKDEK